MFKCCCLPPCISYYVTVTGFISPLWLQIGAQYNQANIGTRVWRTIRVSRLLLLTALMAGRMKGSRDMPEVVFALYVGLGLAAVLILQLTHGARRLLCSRADKEGAAASHLDQQEVEGITAKRSRCASCTGAFTSRLLLAAVAGGLLIAGAGIIPNLFGPMSPLDAVLGFLCVAVCARWASCVVNITSYWPLGDGARAVHLAIDTAVGATLLSAHFLCALCIPLGSVIHTHMLFSPNYADTVEVIVGSSRVLDRQGRGSGAKFFNLADLQLEFKRNASVKTAAAKAAAEGGKSKGKGGKKGGGGDEPAEGPENKIGIRRTKLKAVHEVGGEGDGTPNGAATPGLAGAGLAMGGINKRAVWLQQFRSSEEQGGMSGAVGGVGTALGKSRLNSGSMSPSGRGAAAASAGGGSSAAAGLLGLKINVSHASAAAAGNSSGHGTPLAGTPGPHGTPRVKKTLKQILAEHSKVPTTSAPAGGSSASDGHGHAGQGGAARGRDGIPRGGAGVKGGEESKAGDDGSHRPNFIIPHKGGGGEDKQRRKGPPRANTAGGKRVESAAPKASVADAIAALRNRIEHK